jgi:hypothetical protein
LEIDDGTGGDFVAVVGLNESYLRLYYTTDANITKGVTYRLRYRAHNSIGWGPYSDISYILAATVPLAPPEPTYVSSTSTYITLNIPRSLDDSGSPITGYKLFVDSGDDFTSSYSQVLAYNSQISYAVTGLVTGKVYRFITCAINLYGDSNFSLEVIAGLGNKTPAPSAPTRDISIYSEESMLISWGEVTASDLPVLGYVLEMDDGFGGLFSKVYDG